MKPYGLLQRYDEAAKAVQESYAVKRSELWYTYHKGVSVAKMTYHAIRAKPELISECAAAWQAYLRTHEELLARYERSVNVLNIAHQCELTQLAEQLSAERKAVLEG